MFNGDSCIIYSHRQLQTTSNIIREIHPGCKYIMKKRLDHIQQWRMATRESRVKIEILLLMFQKHIAKVSVSMPNNGCACSSRVKNEYGSFNQFTEALPLHSAVDHPMVFQ